ncbi:hypothetical protein LY90DRAFT_463364 [Neocallimastix californiae]|jgi:hypothetical protein|uniref:HAD-like protein n=1 Tax=Neocallimastix californiae TaxID=1754190 RepID=A0A1Y2AG78_9FUNG|nr:hypothetical protein LY90DRAFT_463364 [Neocallimastix californiae]|eukprot:ORY21482.1 hypothetical protein LY90DRAFT_463364 [Neocallimastix californiae]
MINNLPKATDIKLIATDIDGTLLNPNGKISERTATVIKKVLEKYPNLYFVLASGRSRPATTDICKVLDIVNRPNTESILCNGCIIYDSLGNIIWQNTIPVDFIVKCHEILKDSYPKNLLYSSGDDAFMFDEEWAKVARDMYQEQTVIIDPEEYIEKVKSGESEVNKVCYLVNNPSEAEEIQSKIEHLRKKYNLEYTYSTGIFLDYMPDGTNKGSSLTQLLKILNISKEEVLAFGDGGNDVQLLQNSGWPVAMANAHKILKPHAKIITKSNAEDGVADLLEKIFLKEDH